MATSLSRLVCTCLLYMTLSLPAAAATRLWVALADEGGPYAEAAGVLRSELGGSVELKVARWQALLEESGAPPDLLLAVGTAALEESLKRFAERGPAWERVPVLATLLPQHAYEAIAGQRGTASRPLSAALLDQPLGRQFALLQRVFPDRPRVGVLLGAQTAGLLPTLQREAQNRSRSLATGVAPGQAEIYPALKKVLDDADLLLAVPDPVIYNPGTLQHILLATYRSRVPMVAFSSAHVKAGAVVALYSTPTQVMHRAIEMIQSWRAGRGLPPPQGPRDFAVAVNAKVAASLGLSLADENEILHDLLRQEGLK